MEKQITPAEIFTATDEICNYDLLADLFIYPGEESYKNKIIFIYDYLEHHMPEAAHAMDPFMEYLHKTSLMDMQELYLRSFDVQAITSLDVGYILFGEDYKRGQLLVHLNREHREAGNICHTELSDYLPNVLRLIYKMKDEALRVEIATRLVLPAVTKMIGEFTPEKLHKKDEIYKKHMKTVLDFSAQYRTVYLCLLQALQIVMTGDFNYNPSHADAGHITGCEDSSCSCGTSEKEFDQNIETEFTIEKEK